MESKGHKITAMTGLTADLQEDSYLYAERKNVPNVGIYDINVVPVTGTNVVNGSTNEHWGLYSYLSKVGYDYKSKYLLDLVGRVDLSSRNKKTKKNINF